MCIKRAFVSTILFLLLQLTFSCNNKLKLDPASLKQVQFNELPDTIQKIYLRQIIPTKRIGQNGDTIKDYRLKNNLICLDKDIKNSTYVVEKNGPWTKDFVFTFDNVVLILPPNQNSINPPYILYNKKLYCKTADNFIPLRKAVESAIYGEFDLGEVLKK